MVAATFSTGYKARSQAVSSLWSFRKRSGTSVEPGQKLARALATVLFRCLLWACLIAGSRLAEASFPKATAYVAQTPEGFTHDLL